MKSSASVKGHQHQDRKQNHTNKSALPSTATPANLNNNNNNNNVKNDKQPINSSNVVVITHANAPNYGTMDSNTAHMINSNNNNRNNNIKVTSDSTRSKQMSEKQVNHQHHHHAESEPPKPAVRRKILEKRTEDHQQQVANNNNNNNISNNNIKIIQSNNAMSNSDVVGIHNSGGPMGKQLVNLSRPVNFPMTSKQQQHQDNFEPKPHNSKLQPTAPTTTTTLTCQRPYPKKVIFIVTNEFCERFSYYGLRTVLLLYFQSVLGFSDSASTVSFHLFVTLCYLTPILGAILGDSIWGKYKTILYLSIVYFIGEVILVLSSIFWYEGNISIGTTFIGLILIGIGTGGIKPCVSAFGGDQFHSHETKWRENFFSLFYAAINTGSLISMFLTPMLRANYQCVNRSDCFLYAFGLPCGIMLLSIIVFVSAQKYYDITPLPERNVIMAFCQCVWLALKRKLFHSKRKAQRQQRQQANTKLNGCKSISATKNSPYQGQVNQGLIDSPSPSNSTLSVTSGTEEQLVIVSEADKQKLRAATAVAAAVEVASSNDKTSKSNIEQINDDDDYRKQSQKSIKEIAVFQPAELEEQTNHDHAQRNHWLYLASDRFDDNSIEEFRCVLGILLLFLPTPIYWCLFDQQGSLWTLQALQMDGRILGTSFVLKPDQMMVANPLLLLVCIALFQWIFYPCMNKCNLLTSSIKRMTTGGLIAAAAFVASALIEYHIQQNLPPEMPPFGQSNIQMVNGLSECILVAPEISYVQIPTDLSDSPSALITAINTSGNNHSIVNLNDTFTQTPKVLETLKPLESIQFNLLAADLANQQTNNSALQLNNYQIKFKLSSELNDPGMLVGSSQLIGAPLSINANSNNNSLAPMGQTGGCPFDASQIIELSVGVLPALSTRMLYIEQGNGRLAYKLFNDTMMLPPPGKAKVRLLFEYFGSSTQAVMRQFALVRASDDGHTNQTSSMFNFVVHDGQILLSDYIDIEIGSTQGKPFKLKLNNINGTTFSFVQRRAQQTAIEMAKSDQQDEQTIITIEPGTRNLIIVHQKDSKTFEMSHEELQDNKYRVNLLLQLIPYSLISISEVMFSITGLEFSYSMAPVSMKSVILGAWCLTTALGNLLTVAVVSVHPFANLAHDFLFYAGLMVLDMLIFAIIGYNYKPYRPKNVSIERV